MSKFSDARDGGYPPGVTGRDPHFDLPNADEMRILNNQLHCDHTWQRGVFKFTKDFMIYKQCIKCGKLIDIEIIYRKEDE